jgi:hypothetical protein
MVCRSTAFVKLRLSIPILLFPTMKKRREGDQSQPSPRTFHSYPPVSHVENRDVNESWDIWIIFATHHPETPIL